MRDDENDQPWREIQVDGEGFEWCIVQAKAADSDGRPPHVPRRTASRSVRVLLLRRPGDDVHSFGVVQEPDEPIGETAVRDAIRSFRDTTSLAVDYRIHEEQHARQLATYWSRVPASAHRDLARTWLQRSELRCGRAPDVVDAEDLREICTKTLLAARRLGLAEGDDEAAAQERDVRSAFEKHVGPL